MRLVEDETLHILLALPQRDSGDVSNLVAFLGATTLLRRGSLRVATDEQDQVFRGKEETDNHNSPVLC